MNIQGNRIAPGSAARSAVSILRFVAALGFLLALLSAGTRALSSGSPIWMRSGHPSAVFAAAWLPDGDQFFTGGDDQVSNTNGSQLNLIKLWRRSDNQLVRTFPGHTSRVFGIAVSPDGTKMVSAGEDNSVRVWRVSDGVLLRTLTSVEGGHTANVNCVAFSVDGAYFASGSDDQRILIWPTDGSTGPRALVGVPATAVRSLSFSPDGTKLAAGFNNAAAGANAVRVWDWQTTNPPSATYPLSPAGAHVRAVAYSPNGQYLAVGDEANKCYVLTLSNGQLLWPAYDTVGHNVNGLAWSPDSTRIALAVNTSNCRVLSLSNNLATVLPGSTNSPNVVAWQNQGQWIFGGLNQGESHLWRASDLTLFESPLVSDDTLLSIAVSPDGQLVASSSVDNKIRLWNASTGALIYTADTGFDPHSLKFTPDSQFLIFGDSQGRVRTWQLSNNQVADVDLGGQTIESISMSADGSVVASGDTAHTVTIFTRSGLSMVIERQLLDQSQTINSVAVSPNGRYVLSGSNDNTVRIFDRQTSANVFFSPDLGSDVKAVAISPDGLHFAHALNTGAVQVRDFPAGTLTWNTPRLQNSTVTDLAFSPDSQLIASTGTNVDPTIRYYRTGDSSPVDVWSTETYGGIVGIAFLPAGGRIAYTRPDGTVAVAPSPSLPGIPQNVTAQATSPSAIHVAWDAGAPAGASYRIERRKGAGSYSLAATVNAPATTFDDSGLEANTAYTYRVQAVGALGNSGYSNEASATTMKPVPGSPANFQAAAQSSSAILLTWQAADVWAEQFVIERRLGIAGNFTFLAQVNGSQTSYTDSGLPSNTQYSYRIQAANGTGSSAFAAPAVATTFPPVPGTPTGLQASTLSGTSIRLTWQAADGFAEKFRIEFRTVPGSFGVPVEVGGNLSTFDVGGLASLTTYEFRLQAANVSGSSGYSPLAQATTLQSPPSAPSNVQVLALSKTSLKVTWSDNSSNETGFQIQRRSGGGAYSPVASLGAGVTEWSDTGLEVGTAYDYQVQAVNAGGGSAWATGSGATLPDLPAAPSNLQAVIIASNRIDLSWSDNSSNETKFEIDRQTGGGAFATVGEVGAGVTAFSDTGAAANVAYGYRIRAVNSGGSSDPSNTVQVTIPSGGKLVVPALANLGTVPVGTPKTKSVIIQNKGKGSLAVSVGTPAAPFSVVAGGGSFVLPPKGKHAVVVQFTPSSIGTARGTLQVTSTDPLKPLVNVALTGKGR